MLTPKDLRDIVKILDSTTLDEFHIETDDLSITLQRHAAHNAWTAESRVLRAPELLHPPGPKDNGTGVREQPAASASVAGREHLHRITPPLPGTFYRSPKPGAPPFVEVGATIEPDAVVGIIETMKMMTSVRAGVSGRIAEICLPDAAFAEPDTVLMLVEVAP